MKEAGRIISDNLPAKEGEENMRSIADMLFERGYDKGEAEGEARGEARGKANIIKSMLDKGLTISEIANFTGIDQNTVIKLIK